MDRELNKPCDEPTTTNSNLQVMESKELTTTNSSSLPPPTLPSLPVEFLRLIKIFRVILSVWWLFESQNRKRGGRRGKVGGRGRGGNRGRGKDKGEEEGEFKVPTIRFPILVQSVKQATNENLTLLDLLTIHHLLPTLTFIELTTVTTDYHEQYDRDWAQPSLVQPQTKLKKEERVEEEEGVVEGEGRREGSEEGKVVEGGNRHLGLTHILYEFIERKKKGKKNLVGVEGEGTVNHVYFLFQSEDITERETDMEPHNPSPTTTTKRKRKKKKKKSPPTTTNSGGLVSVEYYIEAFQSSCQQYFITHQQQQQQHHPTKPSEERERKRGRRRRGEEINTEEEKEEEEGLEWWTSLQMSIKKKLPYTLQLYLEKGEEEEEPSSPSLDSEDGEEEENGGDITEPLPLSSTLDQVWRQPFFQGQVNFPHSLRVLPNRPPVHRLPRTSLHPLVTSLLPTSGLYSHQSDALDLLLPNSPSSIDKPPQGIVISTATSSGKSFIYQLAIIESLLLNPTTTTALIIVPTKALANDQINSFRNLVNRPGLDWIKVAAYDGDTPQTDRYRIRSTSHVIFTNPDMIHYSILPHANSVWYDFLVQLNYLVIDEIHVYSNLFGQHVSLTLRRLLRWCRYHHHSAITTTTTPRVIGCSATIEGPREHLSRLTGLPPDTISSIEHDGSPQGAKTIILWDSSLPAPPIVRRPLTDTVELTTYLLHSQLRCLVFCPSRAICENVKLQLDHYLKLRYPAPLASCLIRQVHSYRGGYTPEERREIETRLRIGDLSVVICTNALELGVDIGQLDVVISLGIPNQVSSLRQQMGRAGRRGQDSLMVVIYQSSPFGETVDRSTLLHALATPTLPEGSSPSKDRQSLLPAELDPYLLELHLQCAAKEQPILIESDTTWFGPHLPRICRESLEGNEREGYLCRLEYRDYPARRFQLRGNVGDDTTTFSLLDTSQPHWPLLESLDLPRAMTSLYEGAIHLYRGQRYLVHHLHPKLRYALLRPCPHTTHLTRPIGHYTLHPLLLTTTTHLHPPPYPLTPYLTLHPIPVHYQFLATGYRRLHPRTRECLEELAHPPTAHHPIHLPCPALQFDLPIEDQSLATPLAHLIHRTLRRGHPTQLGGVNLSCCRGIVDPSHPHRVYLFDPTTLITTTGDDLHHVLHQLPSPTELLTSALQLLQSISGDPDADLKWLKCSTGSGPPQIDGTTPATGTDSDKGNDSDDGATKVEVDLVARLVALLTLESDDAVDPHPN